MCRPDYLKHIAEFHRTILCGEYDAIRILLFRPIWMRRSGLSASLCIDAANERDIFWSDNLAVPSFRHQVLQHIRPPHSLPPVIHKPSLHSPLNPMDH